MVFYHSEGNRRKSIRGVEAAVTYTSGACFRLLNRVVGRSVIIMAANWRRVGVRIRVCPGRVPV